MLPRRWRSSAIACCIDKTGGLTHSRSRPTAERSRTRRTSRAQKISVVARSVAGVVPAGDIRAQSARRRAAGEEASLRGRRVALRVMAETGAGSISTDDEGRRQGKDTGLRADGRLGHSDTMSPRWGLEEPTIAATPASWPRAGYR